jgi:sugar lactone lactonase YvrE
MPNKTKTSKLLIILSIGGFLLFVGLLFSFAFYFWKSTPERISFTKVNTFFGFKREIGEPFGIAVKDGEIYVSDGQNGKILRVNDADTFEVVADKLDTPSAIAFDSNGDLIVADSGTHTIKKVKIENGEVETIAGTENQKGFADGDAKTAQFNAPIGITVGENDKIFVADTYNDKIRVIENGQVSTFAGSEKGFSDGIGDQAKFDTPCGIALTKDGKLIVADSGNFRVRVIEENGNTWTLAGNGSQDLFDGLLSEAKFVRPMDVEIDKFGVIYIADGNAIRAIGRRVLPFVETISNSDSGLSDGKTQNSKFDRVSGLAIDESGNLFVADSENQVLRVFTGLDLGKEISFAEIEKLKYSADEFKKLNEPRWTYDPPKKTREIAGTLGEIRGEIKDKDSQAWFHNGLDITGGYGETARFIRDEKVLDPFAVQNYNTLRELIRMPELGYIHIRLGRDKDNNISNDDRFEFFAGEDRKLKDLRIPRGTKFKEGEAIGTLNRMNHVHLVAGNNRNIMNALDALILPGVSDSRPPTIEKVTLFDENWREFETENKNERIKLKGKAHIVVQAFDQMDGNSDRRRLGVYRVGYQILKDEKPTSEIKWTISFDRLPSEKAVKFVYAKGSKSGATGQTIFNYIASNEVNGSIFRESFLDGTNLETGVYILRVFVADFFGNQTSKDITFEIGN